MQREKSETVHIESFQGDLLQRVTRNTTVALRKRFKDKSIKHSKREWKVKRNRINLEKQEQNY